MAWRRPSCRHNEAASVAADCGDAVHARAARRDRSLLQRWRRRSMCSVSRHHPPDIPEHAREFPTSTPRVTLCDGLQVPRDQHGSLWAPLGAVPRDKMGGDWRRASATRPSPFSPHVYSGTPTTSAGILRRYDRARAPVSDSAKAALQFSEGGTLNLQPAETSNPGHISPLAFSKGKVTLRRPGQPRTPLINPRASCASHDGPNEILRARRRNPQYQSQTR